MPKVDILLTYIDFLETYSDLNHSYYLPHSDLNFNLNVTLKHLHLKI